MENELNMTFNVKHCPKTETISRRDRTGDKMSTLEEHAIARVVNACRGWLGGMRRRKVLGFVYVLDFFE
jgi:hypothetical protein